jgi:FKBP-type peptidyl-prolyl cis-trans isomerase FklB
MKNHQCILLIVTSVVAVMSGPPVRRAAAQTPPVAQSATSNVPTEQLKSPRDKLSYAIGASLGARLKRESADVDPSLVSQGIKDAQSGAGTLLAEHEVGVIVAAFENELQKRRITAEAEKIVAANALAEKQKKAGEAFLAENKKKEGTVSLESGLQYKVLKAGEGKMPSVDDSVVCHYRATLMDGTEIDNSYKDSKPITVPLKGAIKGWNEALQLMPVGSKWQLFIPPGLAYGVQGAPRSRIGPNATLIFEVELLSIEDRLTKDRAAAKDR